MPSGQVNIVAEITTPCGITKTFNSKGKMRMWEKLHKKCCERCRISVTVTHQAEVHMCYDSVANLLGTQQDITDKLVDERALLRPLLD